MPVDTQNLRHVSSLNAIHAMYNSKLNPLPKAKFAVPSCERGIRYKPLCQEKKLSGQIHTSLNDKRDDFRS